VTIFPSSPIRTRKPARRVGYLASGADCDVELESFKFPRVLLVLPGHQKCGIGRIIFIVAPGNWVKM